MILSDNASKFVGLLFVTWCIFLIILTLKGSGWLRKRSKSRAGSKYGQYEQLVSYWMLFGAILLLCMLGLLILSLLSN